MSNSGLKMNLSFSPNVSPNGLKWTLPAQLTLALVGLNGLEPSTSRLSGVRSNQLSYKPLILAATYSPTPSPVQYLRPLTS